MRKFGASEEIRTLDPNRAGAVGKPVWILIPAHGTDWRWMYGRTDSPWYPSATLYRQKTPGGWASVIERVKADLDGLEPAPAA